MRPAQLIQPIRGGRAGAAQQVLRLQRDEELQCSDSVYGLDRLAQLVDVLGGPGRGTWAVTTGDAATLELEPGQSPEEETRQIVDWLADDAGVRGRRAEVVVLGSVITTPKSWAITAVADDELLGAIRDAMPRAIQAYLDAVHEHTQIKICPYGEPLQWEAAQGVRAWAASHTISGAGDPHLHAHVLVATRAQGISGRYGRIWQPSVLEKAARIGQGAAMHVLRQAVASAGYALDQDAEIVGASDRTLIEAASRAQTSVNMLVAALSAEGITVEHEAAWRMYRQLRARRPVKGLPEETASRIRELVGVGQSSEALEHAMDEAFMDDTRRGELVRHWSTVYDRDLVGMAREARAKALQAQEIDPVDQVVMWLSEYRTAATTWTVLAWATEVVGPEKADELVEELRQDPRVVPGEKQWATVERALREDQIVERVKALVPEEDQTPQEALARVDTNLAVISGVAGAGKTTLLTAAQPHWGQRTTWATARNAEMARQVGEALGVEDMSLHRLRKLIDRGRGPQAGDVVVCDEIALLEHRDVELVLRLAESGVIVKTLGDERQLPGIDGSTSARLLVETARSQGQPYLDVSQRCKAWRGVHDALRRATEDPDADLTYLMAHLPIVPISKPTDAVALNPAEILVRDNATRSEIAEALPRPPEPRDDRQVVRGRDDAELWHGDRVVCRENVWQHGHLVLGNGERGEIVTVGPRAVVVERSRDGEQISLPRTEVADKLALGGCWTGDAAQGQTFQRAVPVVTGAESSEWIYSAAARSLELPVIAVTVDDDVPAADRQRVAEDKFANCLGHSRRAGTVRELAERDPEFAANLTTRLHPPEPELTPEDAGELVAWEARQDALDQDAWEAEQETPEAQAEQNAPAEAPVTQASPVTTTEPPEAREAPVTAQGRSQAQGVTDAAVVGEDTQQVIERLQAHRRQQQHDEALAKAVQQCKAAKAAGAEWEASGWAVRQYIAWLDDLSHTGPGRDVVEERLSDAIDLRHSLKLDEVAVLDDWSDKERERRQQASRRPPTPPQRSHVDHERDQYYQPPPPPAQSYDGPGLSL